MQLIYFRDTFTNISSYARLENEATEKKREEIKQLIRQAKNEKAIKQLNAQLRKTQPLRQQHLDTLRTIIKLYAAELNKANCMSLEHLPSLKTNNIQLAKMLHCGPSTVYRHIKRLMQSNGRHDPALIHKIFHGSNASYELVIDPDLICFCPVLEEQKLEARKSDQELIREVAGLSPMRSICNHTDTGTGNNTLKDKVEKSISVTDKNSCIGSASVTDKNGYSCSNFSGSNDLLTGNREPQQVSCQKDREAASQLQTGTEVPAGHERAPAGSDLLQIIDLVARLWLYIQNKLYDRIEFLTQSEIERGKIHLFREFLPLSPSRYQGKYYELKARLYIVSAWLDRDRKRYVPIPSKYFDPSNSQGFGKTAKWLSNQERMTKYLEQAKADFITERSQYMAWKKSNRDLEKAMRMYFRYPGNYEGYRKAHQYLNKIDPTLADEFNSLIIEKQKAIA